MNYTVRYTHECLTLCCSSIPTRTVKLVDAGHMLAIYSERFFDGVVRELRYKKSVITVITASRRACYQLD